MVPNSKNIICSLPYSNNILYARHYKPQLEYLYPFSLLFIIKTSYYSCSKQGNSSTKSAVYNQERFQAKSWFLWRMCGIRAESKKLNGLTFILVTLDVTRPQLTSNYLISEKNHKKENKENSPALSSA